MSPIAETNITTSIVETDLGESTNNIKLLCTSGNVVKWSRKKPVVIHNSTPSEWYKALDGDWGFNLPTGSMINGYPTGDWTYVKPNDTNGYRLGDFRGYDKTHIPAISMDSAPSTLNFAVTSSLVYVYSKEGDTADAIQLDEFSTDYEEYYFGIRLNWNGNNTYLTATTKFSGAVAGVTFDLSAAPFNGWTGTYTWDAFLCESQVTLVNNPTGAGYEHAVLRLPDYGTHGNTGTTVVSYTPIVSVSDDTIDGTSIGTAMTGIFDSRANWSMKLTSLTGSNVDISNYDLVIEPILKTGTSSLTYNLTAASGVSTVTTSGTTLTMNNLITWSDVAELISGYSDTIVFSIEDNGNTVWTDSNTVTAS